MGEIQGIFYESCLIDWTPVRLLNAIQVEEDPQCTSFTPRFPVLVLTRCESEGFFGTLLVSRKLAVSVAFAAFICSFCFALENKGTCFRKFTLTRP